MQRSIGDFMNFKILLTCLFFVHTLVQGNNFYLLDQAVMDSDSKVVREFLAENKISQARLMSILSTSQDIIRHRQDAINNYLLVLAVRPLETVVLPPHYEARVGGEASLCFGVLFFITAIPFLGFSITGWREHLRNSSSDWSSVIETASPKLMQDSGIAALSTLISYVGLYSFDQSCKMGLKFRNAVCREYLEDMYKNALQVKQLITDQVEQIS